MYFILCIYLSQHVPFTLGDTTDSTGSQASLVVIVEGQEDMDIPYPFLFPSHYRSDIEMGLKLKVMSPLTFTKFLTRIANVMFLYKRYPKRADYESVAEQIVTRYPFMRSPLERTVSVDYDCSYYFITVIHFNVRDT